MSTCRWSKYQEQSQKVFFTTFFLYSSNFNLKLEMTTWNENLHPVIFFPLLVALILFRMYRHLNHFILFFWRHMPGHTSREILIILSSLTTCDPANIYELIKERGLLLASDLLCACQHVLLTLSARHLFLQQTLKSLKVRVSVIGLSAEVRVCTVLTRETSGSYHVILDEGHFKELLMLHVKPPPASSSSECSLIRMGQCTATVNAHTTELIQFSARPSVRLSV